MPRVDAPLFLVGFMGSGKSCVGRALALRLGWEHVDTDERIVAAAGRSIERIFAEAGEAHFRRLEWDELQRLGTRQRAIVSTGGGLFLGLEPRRWIRAHGTSVWLDVPLELVRRRVAGAGGRPLWDGAEPIALRALYDRRRAAYALADRRIDAAGDLEGVVERVLAVFR
ncbi:MAG TPA: shikimate kinase [Candidatus Polarisedimenticolaceae bacterium]|nr:shikimate kinase [Candidatus Polarisedimenticolaceae bacterium]